MMEVSFINGVAKSIDNIWLDCNFFDRIQSLQLQQKAISQQLDNFHSYTQQGLKN